MKFPLFLSLRVENFLLFIVARCDVIVVVVLRAVEAKLRFVDAAVGDEGRLLGPAALSAEVGHPVDDLDAGDDVAEDAGELVAHVRQDDAELRGDLERNQNKDDIKRKANQ